MTRATRHSRAPLRRSSAPERILSAGLATATCVGVVGLLGARTIEANATASVPESSEVEASQALEPVALAAEPTTSSGLTQADLDAYAAQLATEKDRLDAYRAKLVKTAKKLQKAAAAQRQEQAFTAQSWTAPQASGSSNASRPAAKAPAAKAPAAKAPTAKPKAPKPAPQAKAAPQPAPAPAPQPAPKPKPQSNTKSS
jgi:hypothetical protein